MNKQHAYQLALQALEAREKLSLEALRALVGSTERSTVSGPDGQTYFLEVSCQELAKGSGFKLTATVDLGSSFRLERIEESTIVQAG